MSLQKMLVGAVSAAEECDHAELGPEHFLVGLSGDDSAAAKALQRCGLTPERLMEMLRSLPDTYRAKRGAQTGDGRPLGRDALRTFGRAEGLALGMDSQLRPEHVLAAILLDKKPAVALTCIDRASSSVSRVRQELEKGGFTFPSGGFETTLEPGDE